MDARTTPRWLQVPALLLLLGLAAYFVAVNVYAVDMSRAPAFLRRNGSIVWFGGWRMFTYLDTGHSRLVADAERDGEWQRVALGQLFPFRWESGPRYARSSFRRSGAYLKTLGQATCGRLAERGEPADRVRLSTVSWRRTLGQRRQPRRGKRVRTHLVWDCDRRFGLPRGRRW